MVPWCLAQCLALMLVLAQHCWKNNAREMNERAQAGNMLSVSWSVLQSGYPSNRDFSEKMFLWALFKHHHLVTADLLSSLPHLTVSSLRTGTELCLTEIRHNMLTLSICKVYKKSICWEWTVDKIGMLEPWRKRNGNSKIQLLCRTCKNTLVNIS